jgi:lysylphosphatidylglycerol synthetase-like protein (DUF2156 family)
MDDRTIAAGATDLLPPPAQRAAGAVVDTPLGDPRALTILTTEHWSLLSARSLVYNEAFARAGMFLTFLSASLVALALVAQGMGFSREFLLLAAVILGFDLFIGFATLGRVASASDEDLRCIAGMNRIRNAYFDIAPGVEPYFVSSRYDDVAGVLSTYGESPDERPAPLATFAHGLTTTVGMIGVITAIIAGILGAIVSLLISSVVAEAIVVGAATFVVVFLAVLGLGMRNFMRFSRRLGSRFPTPPAEGRPPR